jgi:hypothetical protein
VEKRTRIWKPSWREDEEEQGNKEIANLSGSSQPAMTTVEPTSAADKVPQ